MDLTIRNIPDEVMEKIRTLSKLGRRSINNEILLLLEQSVQERIGQITNQSNQIAKEAQINIWRKIGKEWDDDRTKAEMIDEIYQNRTIGRDVKL